jgi:flagellar biosynthesis protein FlhG
MNARGAGQLEGLRAMAAQANAGSAGVGGAGAEVAAGGVMAASPLLRAAHAANAVGAVSASGAASAASSNGNTPRRAPKVPFVAITGAKGGVGKTVVATNLALLLAQQGYKTLLVDLDPSCGNVDVHLRIARARSLDDVATGMCTPHEAIYEAPFGLRVLAGKSGSSTLLDAAPDLVDRVFAAVERAADGFDVVVLDTGAGLGSLSLRAAERADLAIAITTTDPSAITDAYAQCKLLHSRGRPLPRLLVNGAQSRDEAMRTAGKFSAVCRKFLGVEAAFFGSLRRDAALERSVLEQRPLVLTGYQVGGATSGALAELRGLCAAVLAGLPTMQRRAARVVSKVSGM